MWLRRPKRTVTDFGFQNFSGLASDPATQAAMARNAQAFDAYNAAKKADARRQFKQAVITGAGVMGGSVGLGAMMGGGAPSFGIGAANTGTWSGVGAAPAAAGVATGAGGTVAPVVGGAKAGLSSKLGALFTSPLASTLAQGAFSLIGQRSQNKAADQARRDTLAANAEALKLQREQLEMETRNADLDREELRAQNAAINELKKRELEAAEEVRAFDREQALYLRSKDEAAEQRRAPYRQAGQAALGRLMSMWGL